MSDTPNDFQVALKQAQEALAQDDRFAARSWAHRAVATAPDREEGWLILAACASPKASVVYLKHALEINPQSQRARQGIHWAIQRLRSTPPQTQTAKPTRRQIVTYPIPSKELINVRPALLPWAIAVILVLISLTIWFGSPTFSFAFTNNKPLPIAQSQIDKETRTPTPTATFTPTPTYTPTPTPTITPSPTPTNTPTATATNTPKPTKKPKKKSASSGYSFPGRPRGVDPNERWIDVDLSSQRTYAYQGNELIKSFVVSTGTWRHPTVRGTYKIYVKYRSAPMSGPGYYLPNVPYIMYFYKGYGLHGTYWHNNFGTPMSHGCINLKTKNAAWLYNFASVGTIVNIHQ